MRPNSLLAAGLALIAHACAESAPALGRRADVLFVTVDTLRADYVTCYGAPDGLTPRLDGLAEQGALFEQHHTVMSHTAPSHATMFTGLHPREHRLFKNGYPLSATLPSLPEALRAAGYRTGAAIGSKVLASHFGFDRGFEVFDEDFSSAVRKPTGTGGAHERYAEAVMDAAVEFLRTDDGRPVFLWVHVYDPHMPYDPPSDWREPRPLRDRKWVPPAVERFEGHKMRAQIRAYADEVSYTDRQVGRLLKVWDERMQDRTNLVVVTSDHGEGLFEHEYPGHGFFLYQEQLHVPLLVRMQGVVPAGTRVARLTSSTDLPATILELVDVPPPEGLGGRSLADVARGREGSAGVELAFAERRRYSEYDLKKKRALVNYMDGGPGSGTGEIVALVLPGWKAIWSEDGPFELYDLAADPDERTNLSDLDPERAAEMRGRIEAWRLATAGEITDDIVLDPEVQEMLDDLGY